MALEIPNNPHASMVAFYAEPGALAPPNDGVQWIVTALAGIQEISFPPAPTFSGDFTDGLMLRLQEPLSSSHGIWFITGWDCEDIEDEGGLTPLLLELNTGEAVVDDFAAEIGNFMILDVDPLSPFGFFTVNIFELPRVDDAELPATLPISS